MKYLLDTHVLLWWVQDDLRLSSEARATIAAPRSVLLWSSASTWELAIKASRGHLRLPAPVRLLVPRMLQEEGILPFPVTDDHASRVEVLPPHHRDPFDRLLVAQAQAEGASLISADTLLRAYDVPVLW